MKNKCLYKAIRYLLAALSFCIIICIIKDISSGENNFFNGETIASLIGSILLSIQLNREVEARKQEARIQESSFVKDYNQFFIENKGFTEVERVFEDYFDHFKKAVDKYQSIEDARNSLYVYELVLENYMFSTPGTERRQKLIDYLVYLESLATVINNGTMQIENIDSIMGYRYFIAVNNPVVQKMELIPFAEYYRGILGIYEKWVDYHTNPNKIFSSSEEENENRYGFYSIPMFRKQFALCWYDRSNKDDSNNIDNSSNNLANSNKKDFPCEDFMNILEEVMFKEEPTTDQRSLIEENKKKVLNQAMAKHSEDLRLQNDFRKKEQVFREHFLSTRDKLDKKEKELSASASVENK